MNNEILKGRWNQVKGDIRNKWGKITDDDLDRVVDTRWDPPVTLGVRLVSVVSDTLQHVGQAAYVRGILLRRD